MQSRTPNRRKDELPRQQLKILKTRSKTEYASQYDRTLLQPVPRALNRDGLGITQNQPFTIGADIWTAYEISWLNEKAYRK